MLLRLGLVLLLVCVSSCTLSRSDKKKKVDNSEPASGAIDKDVLERGLVTEKPKWKEVVENHAAYHKTSHRAINHMNLAYVTPWNNHGYDVAKLLGGKFTHVSPVWLQVRWGPDGTLVTQGEHDIDQGWVRDVRRAGASAGVKIVPRLLFDGWQPAHFRELFESASKRQQLAADIVNLIKKHGFDGIVLEVWSQVPTASLLQRTPTLIRELAMAVREAGYVFILVIPPPVYLKNSPGSFTREHFQELIDAVDALSLMTYDFSSFQNPGPNSPLWWMKDCVEMLEPDATSPNRAKILMGMNLYGLDHSVTGGSHVLGQQFLQILTTYKPKFTFDRASQEHFIEYKTKTGRHVCFYPTLYSLSVRVNLANDLGTGVSLWEIGQGLDYFYDLL
ncbi:hypothetical protein Pmani_012051 [Petrolisthes manimaculis]|uniref:Chitinase domain-containing protein 1 n=1 Tax=Petrolisthes manimaculis TaxID=1843537 RepID=A0AAE1PYT5_9EUCA|nr:hypothetical protein Pmani_012051 [Petrolisthes manimaculis]